MDKIAKIEWGAVAALALIAAAGVVPAGFLARQEARDGIRRTELIEDKRALEQIYNKEDAYPLEYDAAPHRFVVVFEEVGSAKAWFVRAELERRHGDEHGFDLENNVYYRYVNDEKKTFFDICGGISTCGVEEGRN